ncbi:hypothetical protein DL93DRAFT_2170905 [Clavulina sp. PMI_390]|nr:hypothetical protein DL93DRAFT_2170905 [Clavulina sp. PMI_390]
MPPESDLDARARQDLIALLSVAQQYVPKLHVSPIAPTETLWEVLKSVIERSNGELARLSKPRRAECYRALIKAGLVQRLVAIVVDFAHLEKVSEYTTSDKALLQELIYTGGVRVFRSPSQPSWGLALAILARLCRKFPSFESFIPLPEWRKYAARLVAVYRGMDLSHPVQGQGEHAALSMVRFHMINSLSDILLSGKWDPEMQTPKEDLAIMTNTLPLLFDLLATIESPPSLQISSYLATTLSVQIHAVLNTLHRANGRVALPLTALTGYSVEKLIRICAAPIDDSVERFEQRQENLACLAFIIAVLPTDASEAFNVPGLLEPMIETRVLTRIMHLIRDCRDHPDLCKSNSMDGDRSGQLSGINGLIVFLMNVQGHCGINSTQPAEELMKTDLFFLLEWWSLDAPPNILGESLRQPLYVFPVV